ncbi:hypothetical protein BBJ28_00024627 [Nothophytophthora sp. Chile5]|nr:hypothetical protein BBJ28_00024627 [Nothophytophthora sp. Chile5]
MGEAVYVTVLRVLTTITAVLVVLAPAPDVVGIYRRKGTGDVRVLPIVMIFCNSHIWAMYGYETDDIFPLFAESVFGEVVNLVFLFVYYRFSTERKYIRRLCFWSAVALVIVTLYVILATTGVTHESHSEMKTILGYVSVVINICMYGSPLAAMVHVVRTKSAASIPIVFCAVSFVNCALWTVFGVGIDDMFVLAPNAIATVLSAVQIVLYGVYRPKKGAGGEELLIMEHNASSLSGGKPGWVAVASPVEDASIINTVSHVGINC